MVADLPPTNLPHQKNFAEPRWLVDWCGDDQPSIDPGILKNCNKILVLKSTNIFFNVEVSVRESPLADHFSLKALSFGQFSNK